MPGSREHFPRYRLLSGPDDDAFCDRVSEALEMGYVLHGFPSATFDGKSVIVVQAVVTKWRRLLYLVSGIMPKPVCPFSCPTDRGAGLRNWATCSGASG